MSSSTTDIAALLDAVLATSVPLHPAIAHFGEPGARYELAGEPGVAMFTRESADTISHVSSSPSPALVPVLDELRERHLRLAGVAEGSDNSHLPALLLLAMQLADRELVERLGIASVVRRPAQIVALDEESGRHDPEIAVGDVTLRAWTPLAATHMTNAGVHQAVLEFRFSVERYERYAPW